MVWSLGGHKRAISHTTRSPRDNEVEGIDYFFVSEGELDKLWEDGLLGVLYSQWV